MLLDYILRDGNRDLAAFTEKLTDYLKKYFVIGGMPSAILKWLDTHDFFEVDDVQKQLVAAYENDFSKHAPRQMIEKIRYVWDSILCWMVSVSAMLVYTCQKNIAQAFILERYFFVSICPAAIPGTCLSVFLAAVLPLC